VNVCLCGEAVLEALLTLLASALSFHHQLAPGDTLKQNPKISPERIEALRQQFGLDRSWRAIWALAVENLTQGDFGTSFVYQRSVASLLWGGWQQHYYKRRIFNCYLGDVLGYHRRRQTKSLVDRLLRVISYAGQGFPASSPPYYC